MRKIFIKLDRDSRLKKYFCSKQPFIQNNMLSHVDAGKLQYIGKVAKNGTLEDGAYKPLGIDIKVKKKCVKRKTYTGKKIIIAPDSFKGSLTSEEAINVIAGSARRNLDDVSIIPIPVADGGEGTVNAFINAVGGECRRIKVTSPLGEKIDAKYAIVNGRTAIIEMAEASGLMCVQEKDVMNASSFGTGEIIKKVVDSGIKDIVIGIGGSATNDGGIGCARALGIKMFDCDENELMGSGKDLINVAKIDTSGLSTLFKDVKIRIMCDVKNPLLGANGATRVYARQKGADDEQIEMLEKGMENYCMRIKETLGIDMSCVEGAGAAGGMGAFLMAFLGGEYANGIETLLDIIDFDYIIKNVSLVITGEGRFDSQSMNGKVVQGIKQHCDKQGIPVAIISGCMGNDENNDIQANAVITSINAPMDIDFAMKNAKTLLKSASDRMFAIMKCGKNL